MKRQPAALYEGPTVSGVDVSHWQGTIDWARVAASGQKYAIVRTGDGKDTDRTAVRNLTGAHEAGLLTAVYHYIRSVHGATTNLGVIMEVLATARVPVGFVAIDVEGAPAKGEREAEGAWMGGKDTGHVLSCVSKMGRRLEDRGHRVVIYSGVAWHWHVAQDERGRLLAKRYPLWTPYYTNRDRPSVPVYPDGSPVWDPEWTLWQHAGSKKVPGSVPGIKGNVDLNRWRGDEAALAKWWNPATRSTPPAPAPAFDRSDIEALAMRAGAAGDKPAAVALLETLDDLAKG